ncbi:MAG: S-layer homology domain-containing protein [Oscillospiraceae bacterium]|jgi:hypothetical protein
MKKRISALLLSVLLLLPAAPRAGASFTDVSGDVAIASAVLQSLGIAAGTSATTFSPDSYLTRAQVCVLIVNAMGLFNQVSSYSRKTLFSDVSASSWYNGYVNLAYAQGIVNGQGNGTFSPDAPVTYGEMATVLLRMLKYTSAEVGSVWPLDYTSFCDDLGLSKGLVLTPTSALTRGQAAVLLYRTLKANVNGTKKPYYESINGVASTSEAILLDNASSCGGGSNLLMVYSPGSAGGVQYYTQKNTQSDALIGYLGTLLFNGAGSVVGFIPEGTEYLDVVIESAEASLLTAADGKSYRISSDAVVIAAGEAYTYSASGFLQLSRSRGSTVRMFYNDSGAISCLYLAGGTSGSSKAAVAETAAAASSLSRALGIANKNYAITKNGAATDSSALAQYDVGYYDAASGTLRVSDYRVSGYISAASPSISAAETITIAGHSFEVLECAWDTLKNFNMRDKVTLLLTDDGKVAAAYDSSRLSADMLGILSKDGKSVTLVGSAITLSASTMNYSEDDLGTLVTVSASSNSAITCRAVSGSASGTLDLTEYTVGGIEIADCCSVYEWAGKGYVYDLDGNQGSASSSLRAIDWTEKLSSSYVSYTHTNSAGQIDVILLKDVTGNAYEFGKLKVIENAINLSSGWMDAFNNAATLTNSSGTSSKHLFSGSANDSFVGVAFGQSTYGYGRVVKLLNLSKITSVSAEDFFQSGGNWYAEARNNEYPISEKVEIYISDADSWLSGEAGLANVLADGYDLSLYYDRSPSEGGQVRIIVANAP